MTAEVTKEFDDLDKEEKELPQQRKQKADE